MLYITIVGKILAICIAIIANNTQLSSENCHICILNCLVAACTLQIWQKAVICQTKTPRVQKRWGQSEAAGLHMQLKALISAKAKN